MNLQFETYDSDGEEVSMSIPGRYEVCDRCHGKGTHTNPAIDGNGITSDEMYELGDDFLGDYLSGVYDVVCEECKGQNVVMVPDEARCSKEQIDTYNKYLQDKWELEQERLAEIRYGY
jgi:RecJ-like exonuclease